MQEAQPIHPRWIRGSARALRQFRAAGNSVRSFGAADVSRVLVLEVLAGPCAHRHRVRIRWSQVDRATGGVVPFPCPQARAGIGHSLSFLGAPWACYILVLQVRTIAVKAEGNAFLVLGIIPAGARSSRRYSPKGVARQPSMEKNEGRLSDTFESIRKLIQKGEVRVSEHGYDELLADGLLAREVVEGVLEAVVVEDYPDYPKGPCVLVFQRGRNNQPIHVVWGIPKGNTSPAVLVTVYSPDPELWEDGFLRRRK